MKKYVEQLLYYVFHYMQMTEQQASVCFVQILVWFSEYGLLSNRSSIQSVKSCLFDTESVKVYFKCDKIEFTSSQYGACLIQFHVIKKSLD